MSAPYGGKGIEFLNKPEAALISVIMPCYNASRYLRSAVNSVMEQSHVNVELIVVDDGSTDDSLTLLEQLSEEHAGRIRVLQQPNQGPYPARNRGLRHARGEFVAFLDADDFWEEECLEKLLKAMDRNGAELAYCGWQNIGEGGPGKRPHVPPDYENGDTAALFLRNCPWPIHACLLHRDLAERVGGFSERYGTSLDYDFWLRISALTHNFVLVPEVLAYYRWHGTGQISSNRWRQVVDAWLVRREFVANHPEQAAHLNRKSRRDLVDGALRHAAYDALWKRDLTTAQPLFRRSLLHGALRLRDLKYALPAFLPAPAFAALVRGRDAGEAPSDE